MFRKDQQVISGTTFCLCTYFSDAVPSACTAHCPFSTFPSFLPALRVSLLSQAQAEKKDARFPKLSIKNTTPDQQTKLKHISARIFIYTSGILMRAVFESETSGVAEGGEIQTSGRGRIRIAIVSLC